MKRKYITFLRIVHNGTVNFIRNATLAMAAMAVMIVTLTIVLFSLILNATLNNTVEQITSKIDISVFLKDEVNQQQSEQLVAQLKKLPNVKSVQYLSKAEVLKRFIAQNAGDQQLQSAATEASNPLPATIHIKPYDLNKISDIKQFLDKSSVAALESAPPSYSGKLKEAIDKITHTTNVAREMGLIAVVVFGVVSALIIFNTIQMAIFNRRDEIQIMRLLGASTGYIRGPFVVESAIYGILSAVISVLIVNAFFVAASSTLQVTSFGLLIDTGYAVTYFDDRFWRFLALQLMVGILIGTASSVVATRRYLKFKIK